MIQEHERFNTNNLYVDLASLPKIRQVVFRFDSVIYEFRVLLNDIICLSNLTPDENSTDYESTLKVCKR